MDFNFNNDKQTVMDIKIKDPDVYRVVRDSMLFNVYEGWKPTQKDVYDTIHAYYNPSEDQKRRFKAIFGEELE